MLYAIVRNPLDNIQYFNGYRFSGEMRPWWTEDTMALYLTHKTASTVVNELGEGIVVAVQLHYSKPTPTLDEIDRLTESYDGDM